MEIKLSLEIVKAKAEAMNAEEQYIHAKRLLAEGSAKEAFEYFMKSARQEYVYAMYAVADWDDVFSPKGDHMYVPNELRYYLLRRIVEIKTNLNLSREELNDHEDAELFIDATKDFDALQNDIISDWIYEQYWEQCVDDLVRASRDEANRFGFEVPDDIGAIDY